MEKNQKMRTKQKESKENIKPNEDKRYMNDMHRRSL